MASKQTLTPESKSAPNRGNLFVNFVRTLNTFFGVTKTNYPILQDRTNALTLLYIALSYVYAWSNYAVIYGVLFGSKTLGAICLFCGLPTSLFALWILKVKRNVALSSAVANGGGITTVLLVMLMTGGAWSHQIVWCILAVLATFIVQSARAGIFMTLYVSLMSCLISLLVQPQIGAKGFWEFPFAMLSPGHAYFNAVTMLTGPMLSAACAYIFKSRQENALRESEGLRVEAEAARTEAEAARKKAEELTEQVQEHVRDIKSMLENTKIGLFSVTKELSLHKDYARYLETIVEDKDLAGKSFFDTLLAHVQLGDDEKNKIVTALEYSLGEDEILFEANASVLPRECVMNFVSTKQKTINLDWVPVIDNAGVVEKILVSMVDVTETLKLRAEAEAGRRNLRYLSEVIDLGPQKFVAFEHSADLTWQTIKTILAQGETTGVLDAEQVRQIYVQLHTIKGVSRMYKLSELTEYIHQAEEIIHGKSGLDASGIALLKGQIEAIEASQLAYERSIRPILALMHQAQSASHAEKPFSVRHLLADLQPMANDLAKDLGKIHCPFQIDIAEEVELDPKFYKALADSSIHLIRNSLDHGIETPEERRQKGLPENGSIRVFLDGEGRLAFQDDGRGLALDRLRQKAESLGRKGLQVSDLVELIFESGVSTKESADAISGRGVGMDAVRSFMRGVQSEIQVVPLREEGGYLKFYFAITLPNKQTERLKVAS